MKPAHSYKRKVYRQAAGQPEDAVAGSDDCASATDRQTSKTTTTIHPFTVAVHSLCKCGVINGHGGRASSLAAGWVSACHITK